MENSTVGQKELETACHSITIKGIVGLLMKSVSSCEVEKQVISLGMGDPTAFSCFPVASVAEDAVIDSLISTRFNGYSPTSGLPQTRKALAGYLSHNLPYKLSPDDVYVTSGCTQAIEVALSILARPGANILLPSPGFPLYDLCASFRHLEIRRYDLLPENGWEVDLSAVEALADHNTVGIVIINPGNPCGNVYSYQHLRKIAETAQRLKIPVIADEVYGHLVFGTNTFVPMGSFGLIVPVLTLGSLSKRWMVPGWRLGWFVTCDPSNFLKSPKTIERINKYCEICGGPATFIQAAVPRILGQTKETFHKQTTSTLKQLADLCCNKIKEIPCITCPYKPQGAMTLMVKLNMFELKDIKDDIDFCVRLAQEESVIILPGVAVGLKNWLRITFAADPSSLEEALERVKSFSQRHSNKH